MATYYCIFYDEFELMINSDIIEKTKATIHEKCDAYWSPVGCIYGSECDRIHISREYYYSIISQKRCYNTSCCKKNHNKSDITHEGINIKFNGRNVLIDPEYIIPTQCPFKSIMPHNICPFYLKLICTYGNGCNNVHICPKKLEEVLPEVYNQALHNSKYLIIKYNDTVFKIYLNHILKTEYMIPLPKVKEEYMNQYTIPTIPISDVCLDYLQGKCIDNELCQLLHINSSSYQKLRSAVISNNIKMEHDKQLCPYYSTENGCRYGLKCKYSHEMKCKKDTKKIIKSKFQEGILLTLDDKTLMIPKDKINKSGYKFKKALIKNICTHHTHYKCETQLCNYLHVNNEWLNDNGLLDKIPKKTKDNGKNKRNDIISRINSSNNDEILDWLNSN